MILNVGNCCHNKGRSDINICNVYNTNCYRVNCYYKQLQLLKKEVKRLKERSK